VFRFFVACGGARARMQECPETASGFRALELAEAADRKSGQGGFSPFTGPDADHIVGGIDEDLPVADLSGTGRVA